mmetsp:Transcript_37524/g.73859  ORF Transcript_37524/g.73859 Transcript_37524/m.73859 type:complete len:211 (+) Transcript_37524:321-953(+)
MRRQPTREELKQEVSKWGKMCLQLIDCEKPVIAGVNGTALGIACTSLGVVDLAYASDKATFGTPFMQHGFSPEGGSAYTFSAVMGRSKANEMLLLGRQLSAKQAENCGLIAEVFPDATFEAELFKRARKMASFPPNALKQCKKLCMDCGPMSRRVLHEVHAKELELLVDRFQTKECADAIQNFIAAQLRKKNQKTAPGRQTSKNQNSSKL